MFGRVKDDLDPFSVGAVIAVGGVGHVAASVSHAGGNTPGVCGSDPASPRNIRLPVLRVRCSCHVLHLVDVIAVSFGRHVVTVDKPQGGRVDAIAQATTIRRAVGKDVAQDGCRRVC